MPMKNVFQAGDTSSFSDENKGVHMNISNIPK
jgi:hypothetical protein